MTSELRKRIDAYKQRTGRDRLTAKELKAIIRNNSEAEMMENKLNEFKEAIGMSNNEGLSKEYLEKGIICNDADMAHATGKKNNPENQSPDNRNGLSKEYRESGVIVNAADWQDSIQADRQKLGLS